MAGYPSANRVLLEPFFRHEFGRLVVVLTRSLGGRRLARVEDVVGAARGGGVGDTAGWRERKGDAARFEWNRIRG